MAYGDGILGSGRLAPVAPSDRRTRPLSPDRHALTAARAIGALSWRTEVELPSSEDDHHLQSRTGACVVGCHRPAPDRPCSAGRRFTPASSADYVWRLAGFRSASSTVRPIGMPHMLDDVDWPAARSSSSDRWSRRSGTGVCTAAVVRRPESPDTRSHAVADNPGFGAAVMPLVAVPSTADPRPSCYLVMAIDAVPEWVEGGS